MKMPLVFLIYASNNFTVTEHEKITNKKWIITDNALCRKFEDYSCGRMQNICTGQYCLLTSITEKFHKL